jgi:hypothetical protein
LPAHWLDTQPGNTTSPYEHADNDSLSNHGQRSCSSTSDRTIWSDRGIVPTSVIPGSTCVHAPDQARNVPLHVIRPAYPALHVQVPFAPETLLAGHGTAAANSSKLVKWYPGFVFKIYFSPGGLWLRELYHAKQTSLLKALAVPLKSQCSRAIMYDTLAGKRRHPQAHPRPARDGRRCRVPTGAEPARASDSETADGFGFQLSLGQSLELLYNCIAWCQDYGLALKTKFRKNHPTTLCLEKEDRKRTVCNVIMS